MDIRLSRVPCLIALTTAFILSAAVPVSGQGLLRRLEERVRQRLEEGAALPPAPPAGAAAASDAAPPADQRPTLGVEVDEVAGAGRAGEVVVASVHPNSAAAAAGLRTGDTITSFGGAPISTVGDLVQVLQRSQPGDRLLMVVQRDGQRTDLTVRIQPGDRQEAAPENLPRPRSQPISPDLPRPSSPSPETEASADLPPNPEPEPGAAPTGGGRLGLVVEDPRPTRGRRLTRGALIVETTEGAPGAKAGLRVGDTIVAFDGALIPDAETMISQMRRTRPGQQVELQYVRDQQLGRVKVTLAGPDGSPAERRDGSASDEPRSLEETASRNADGDPMPSENSSPSGLGALGSVFGGLFGGGSDVPPTSERDATSEQDDAATPEEQTAATEAPSPESTPPVADTSELLPSPNADLPPSLEASESETGELEKASSAELRETVRQLEATNRRLEKRLQQLEERMQAILEATADEEP